MTRLVVRCERGHAMRCAACETGARQAHNEYCARCHRERRPRPGLRIPRLRMGRP